MIALLACNLLLRCASSKRKLEIAVIKIHRTQTHHCISTYVCMYVCAVALHTCIIIEYRAGGGGFGDYCAVRMLICQPGEKIAI